MKHFLTLGFALFASIGVFSNSIKTVISNSGSGWGIASNWDPFGVPQDGDQVIIPFGKTISVKGQFYSTGSNLVILVSGTLDFDPSGKLILGANSKVQLLSDMSEITTHGTSSELIEINGVVKYKGKTDGNIKGIMFANNSTGASPFGFLFGVLPLTLTNFMAEHAARGILVKWTTCPGLMAKTFTVERSKNGVGWTEIKTLNAVSLGKEYSVVDMFAGAGNSFYRLRCIGADGKSKYSPVVLITQAPLMNLKAMPNPSRNFVSISFDGKLPAMTYLQLFNSSGKMVTQQPITSKLLTNERLDLSGNDRGMYYVILRSSDRIIATAKIRLQH